MSWFSARQTHLDVPAGLVVTNILGGSQEESSTGQADSEGESWASEAGTVRGGGSDTSSSSGSGLGQCSEGEQGRGRGQKVMSASYYCPSSRPAPPRPGISSLRSYSTPDIAALQSVEVIFRPVVDCKAKGA